jgi:hypothetical protein
VLGADRRWDEPDGPRDRPQIVTGAVVDRRAVLTDSSTRQGYAVAYRTVVDRAYSEAALGERGAVPAANEHATDSGPAKRPDMADRYPNRYVRSADPPPHIEGRGEHPAGWLADINPGRDRPGRPNNCGECARAVNNTWHGVATVAAEFASRKVRGERPTAMKEWSGQAPEPASLTAIDRRLRELGPGSSAIVGFDREDGPGHWFNALNYEGTVLAVDGQSARYEKWPPSKAGLGFDERGMSYSDAIYFAANGEVVPSDHK